MTLPNLYNALQSYVAALTFAFQSGVQVDTGALRNSIKVSCIVNDTDYELHVSLLNYWKWIKEPFPWDKAYKVIGLKEPQYHAKFGRDGWENRYTIDFEYWQGVINKAFEQDILDSFGVEL